jgi:hypothetical protein
MTTREWPIGQQDFSWRSRTASALSAASSVLTNWAELISGAKQGGQAGSPVLEFYAEAGAPEGALYVDGKLVGHVEGVRRL